MGFLIKKFIAFMLYPLSIGILFGLIGLWLFINRRLKLSKLFFLLAMVWILIVSSSFFANPLINKGQVLGITLYFIEFML